MSLKKMSRSKASIQLGSSRRETFSLLRLRFRLDEVGGPLHFDFGGNAFVEREIWVGPLWKGRFRGAGAPANGGIADGVTPVYQRALLLFGEGVEPGSDFRKSLSDIPWDVERTR